MEGNPQQRALGDVHREEPDLMLAPGSTGAIREPGLRLADKTRQEPCSAPRGHVAGSQVSGWQPGMLSTAWALGCSPAAAGYPRRQTVSARLSVPPLGAAVPWAQCLHVGNFAQGLMSRLPLAQG